jgi:hypothetical protein
MDEVRTPSISPVEVFDPASTREISSKSKLCYDQRSVGLSWCQAPIWGLQPDFYYKSQLCIPQLGLATDLSGICPRAGTCYQAK